MKRTIFIQMTFLLVNAINTNYISQLSLWQCVNLSIILFIGLAFDLGEIIERTRARGFK